MKIDLSIGQPRQQVTATQLSGLFGGKPAGGVIALIPLSLLDAYPNQPFRAYTAAKMERLTEDVRVNGVLSPAIVRPKGERYEMLAGHNRWAASRKAGKDTIPAIVQDVDDDTAALIMVNTNLNQRDELLPSEKAFAYRLQMEVMKRQGQRTDLTSRQVVGKLEAADKVGGENGESGRQIQRYIRLTYLTHDLLEQVDAGELSMVPAVALSYLSQEEQEMVLRVSADCERKVSVVQAEQLKKAAGQLTEQYVKELLLPQKRWNPQQEFVNHSRVLIPKEASQEDVAAVLLLVEEYFEKGRAG